MTEAWPEPPAWLALDVTPRRVRRGQEVAIELRAPLPKLRLHEYELGPACLAHYAGVGARVRSATWAAARPGEPVTGAVVVLEGGRARRVRAWLEFVERAGKLTAVARSEPPSTLAEGELQTDRVLRFELPLPVDALPPLTTEVGELRWDLVVAVDRPRFPDLTERESLA